MGVGELAALASAVGWAGSSTALARLGGRYDARVLSAIRLLVATPLLIVFLAAADGPMSFDAMSLPALAMIASGIVGYGIGDTTYIRAMAGAGVQRLAPTATATWVVLSAIGGIVLLHEPAAWPLLLGAVAIVAGCFLIVRRAVGPIAEVLPGQWSTRRTAVAILVIGCAWAAATLLLAGGRGELSAAAAGVLRIPAGGLCVGLLFATTAQAGSRHRLPRGRDLALILAVGILGTGIGSWLYIYAVAEAGAARAVVLNSTSPLMALPLAMVFMRERPTRNILGGTALCVVGTVLVLLS